MKLMRLIRVFPRKTKATPDDDLAAFGPPCADYGDKPHSSSDKGHMSVALRRWNRRDGKKLG